MSDVKLKVTTTTKVNIEGKVSVEGYGYVKAKSMSRSIKLSVNRHANAYYEESISIPEDLFDALGQVFDAVRAERAEQAAA